MAVDEPFLCRYCAQQCEGSSRNPDHVLPAATGSELTERDTCLTCNQRANREVDGPFSRELWVREHRHRHGTRDRYGKTTPAPVVPCELEDGSKILTIMERTGWRPYLPPSEEWVDDNTFRIGADASDADEVLAKKLKRLGRKFEQVEMGPREVESSRPFVRFLYKLDARLWPRLGAKVALALAPYALGNDWLHSDAANGLRATLWNTDEWCGAAATQLRPVSHTMGNDDFGRYFEPPEHVLWFLPTEHGPVLWMVLFGEWLYGVPLGEGWELRDQPAWWLDPVARTVDRTTWGQSIQRIALRFGTAEAA
jgi:HNH endonuclease